MKKNILLSLLIASSLYADLLDDIFKNAKVNGDITLHALTVSQKDPTHDIGFSNTSLGLGLQTDTYMGLSAAFLFRANNLVWENHNGNAEEAIGALLAIVNIEYQDEFMIFTVGRQEIELEWFEDLHQGAVFSTTLVEDTEIVLGYSTKIAYAVDDEIDKYEKIAVDGSYVLDIKNESIEGLMLNPYYMTVPKLFNAYGVKADFESEYFGLTMHYAGTSEKEEEVKDGNIFHLEARAKYSNLIAGVGYVQTDEQGGIGTLDELGDHLNPLEDGEYEEISVYEKDAKTRYLSLTYEGNELLLNMMYRSTDYNRDKHEKEFDVIVKYEIADDLMSEFVFAKIFANENKDDQNKLMFLLSYEF